MTDQDRSKLRRVHHVELVVGNAKQAAHFYRKKFGFSQIAYRGLETGSRQVASYVLGQNRFRLVLSSPLIADHPHNRLLMLHGDTVLDVAIEVDNVDVAYQQALAAGAKSVLEPRERSDKYGSMRVATIQTYGDTQHSLLNTENYDGPFTPGFVDRQVPEPKTGILCVDHVVGNVERGQMNSWADFYTDTFGFRRYLSFDDKDISTEYSALQSVVMANQNHSIKFPINEPAPGQGKSQIQEYLDFHSGPGVQHIALLTDDIISCVDELRHRGIDFLQIPDSYYDMLADRVGEIDEPIDSLRRLGVLVDRDEDGYLLQLFTKPMLDRPTLFFEIIQRKGARGFGKGNFKALFMSIEQEQALRGNL